MGDIQQGHDLMAIDAHRDLAVTCLYAGPNSFEDDFIPLLDLRMITRVFECQGQYPEVAQVCFMDSGETLGNPSPGGVKS